MAIIWSKPDETLLSIARDLIDRYHPDLADARIGFLFREPTPESNGFRTLGKAKKVSPQDQEFMDLDFVIWVAYEFWSEFPDRREALLDHELCHCKYDPEEEKAKTVGHDIEEFIEVIDRHGYWRPSLKRLEMAIKQLKLPLDVEYISKERVGELVGIDPERIEVKTLAL